MHIIVPSTLKKMYKPKLNHCPALIKLNASNPKVEKVVYPPHIPIIQKARKKYGSVLTSQYLKQNPIKIAPDKFVNKVCHEPHELPKTKTNDLKTDPIAPPLATSRKNFQSMREKLLNEQSKTTT